MFMNSTMAMNTTIRATAVGSTKTVLPLPTFTGAAAREVGSLYGLAGAVLAGVAYLG